MIFVAKTADFSAKNIGVVEIDFDYTEQDTPSQSQNLVTMIEINDPVTEVKEGSTTTFTASVYPENAENKTIRWSCSPTTIATINASTGVLTAITSGEVTVMVKATDGSDKKDTCTVTVIAKTKEDCSTLTKQVLGYYGTHHTDVQALAVDKMIENLGGNTEGSIWSKLDIVFMPCLANNIDKAFVNAKNGKDHMEYSAAGKINAVNNSIDWNTIYTVANGCVKCLDTSNIKNTLNIPIYRFNNSSTGITGANYTMLWGGSGTQWAGGTGCMIPITTSTALYTASGTSVRVGADYSSNCIKGLSVKYVSETEGFEYTVNAPADKVSATYGSQEILTAHATSNSGAAKHWNTYMRCTEQYYLMVLSQYLNQEELELTISEFDKVMKIFNVDQTK